jgi:hypothetical protein
MSIELGHIRVDSNDPSHMVSDVANVPSVPFCLVRVIIKFPKEDLRLTDSMERSTTEDLLCCQLQFVSYHSMYRLCLDRVVSVEFSRAGGYVVLCNNTTTPQFLARGTCSTVQFMSTRAFRDRAQSSDNLLRPHVSVQFLSARRVKSSKHAPHPMCMYRIPRMFEFTGWENPNPAARGERIRVSARKTQYWDVRDSCLVGCPGSKPDEDVGPASKTSPFDHLAVDVKCNRFILRELFNGVLRCHARVHEAVFDSIAQFALPRLFEGHAYYLAPKNRSLVISQKPRHTTFVLDAKGFTTLTLRG